MSSTRREPSACPARANSACVHAVRVQCTRSAYACAHTVFSRKDRTAKSSPSSPQGLARVAPTSSMPYSATVLSTVEHACRCDARDHGVAWARGYYVWARNSTSGSPAALGGGSGGGGAGVASELAKGGHVEPQGVGGSTKQPAQRAWPRRGCACRCGAMHAVRMTSWQAGMITP